MSKQQRKSLPGVWRSRLLASGVGLLLMLGCLEGMLRIVGAWVESRGSEGARAGAQVVLCVGDSYTWGIGAHADKTWPAWLERLLNAHQGARYQVINRARAGSNSTHMVESLQQHIDQVRPDLVILLTGSSNLNWNLHGASEVPESTSARAQELAYSLRVVRLALLLKRDLEPQLTRLHAQLWLLRNYRLAGCTPATVYQQAWDDLKQGQRSHALALLDAYTAVAGLQAETCVLLCEAYLDSGERVLAEHYYAAATSRLAERSWLAPLLQVKRERLDKAIGLLRAQGSATTSSSDAYFTRIMRERQGLASPPQNVQQARTWVGRDMRTAMAICRQSHTRVLLLNYPNQSASLAMEDASKRYQVPLVDVESAFRNLQQRERYFIPDGHCNDLGYEIMARAIYPEVVRLLALPVRTCLPILPPDES